MALAILQSAFIFPRTLKPFIPYSPGKTSMQNNHTNQNGHGSRL